MDTPAVRPHRQAGFSMVELSVVLLAFCTITGIAMLNINGIMPGLRANAALHQTVAQLRMGREMAIAQRRNVEIRFVGNNQIQLVRIDVPTGTTLLSTATLENKAEFHRFDGVPDTPDSFGNSAAVDFGSASQRIFLSDGTLVNSQGDALNGSVFLGVPNRPETARAITILGTTGRVRGYRWTGDSWIQ